MTSIVWYSKGPVQQGPISTFGQKWALTVIIYNQEFFTRFTPFWAWNLFLKVKNDYFFKINKGPISMSLMQWWLMCVIIATIINDRWEIIMLTLSSHYTSI